jgi:D-threo-aldose 1-dehydrogenase
METRRLGRTGLYPTLVGLGGAPLAHERCSDQEAMETVWASLEAGMNLIDTAPLYGGGRSEILIGQALRQRPDLTEGLIICTKTGRYLEGGDYSYDNTLRSVARSLERLGVAHLDIVHIHDVGGAEDLRQVMQSRAAHAALRQLQSEGVVGHIGLGIRRLETLQFALESGEFDVLMMANQYNLLEQAGRPILEDAARRDVGVIIAGAYATGILAKGAVPEARYGYRPPSEDVLARTAALEALCARWDVSLPAAAVQFCLRGPAAQAVTVLGAREPAQTLTNVATVAQEIPAGFWAELQEMQG